MTKPIFSKVVNRPLTSLKKILTPNVFLLIFHIFWKIFFIEQLRATLLKNVPFNTNHY